MIEINKKTVIIPKELQAPPLELSKDETQTGIKVFDYSLDFLIKHFPNSSIVVIYIPSVANCYSLQGNIYLENKPALPELANRRHVYPFYLVKEKSDDIARRIESVCKRNSVRFFDTRSYMKLAALKEQVHGPCEWCHFNRYGYEKFSECIVSFLRREHLVN